MKAIHGLVQLALTGLALGVVPLSQVQRTTSVSVVPNKFIVEIDELSDFPGKRSFDSVCKPKHDYCIISDLSLCLACCSYQSFARRTRRWIPNRQGIQFPRLVCGCCYHAFCGSNYHYLHVRQLIISLIRVPVYVVSFIACSELDIGTGCRRTRANSGCRGHQTCKDNPCAQVRLFYLLAYHLY